MMKAAVITISDRGAAGLRKDESGRLLTDFFARFPAQIVDYQIVPDDHESIRAAFRKAVSKVGRGVVFSTGGTGFSPRDITPEAVGPLLDAFFPGVMELFRRDGMTRTPMAALSRGVAGRLGDAFIVTLPGSVKAVREACLVLGPLIKEMLSKNILL